MLDRSQTRVIAVCAFSGCLLLIIGTYLHPMPDDPNDALQTFAAYAADRLWIASHLMQLAGVALILTTLTLIGTLQRQATVSIAYQVAAMGAIVCLAIAGALQAIDGIALKKAVNSWSQAPAETKNAAFSAAFAIRQIEIGLASVLSIAFGVTATLYGSAMLADDIFPAWLAILALPGGIATAISGVVMAYSGFSALEMIISMPASYLLLLWVLIIGVVMWQRSRQLPAAQS
jgi:Domain of unknown function (DUF4386)